MSLRSHAVSAGAGAVVILAAAGALALHARGIDAAKIAERAAGQAALAEAAREAGMTLAGKVAEIDALKTGDADLRARLARVTRAGPPGSPPPPRVLERVTLSTGDADATTVVASATPGAAPVVVRHSDGRVECGLVGAAEGDADGSRFFACSAMSWRDDPGGRVSLAVDPARSRWEIARPAPRPPTVAGTEFELDLRAALGARSAAWGVDAAAWPRAWRLRLLGVDLRAGAGVGYQQVTFDAFSDHQVAGSLRLRAGRAQ